MKDDQPWVTPCVICHATDGVRMFGTSIDGELLRMVFPLCKEHGDRYLLKLGRAIGEFIRDGGEVKP